MLVMIKQVPDVSLVEIDENGILQREGVPAIVDPSSLIALKMAVKIRKMIGGKITAVTMGPSQAREALMTCLEHGADEAFILNDKSFAGSDTWATAKVLSTFVRNELEYDVIFCGMQAIDGDTAQVPAELSVMLGAELASYVNDFRIDGGRLVVSQNYDRETRWIDIRSPAVISVSGNVLLDQGLPSIHDYLEARKKTIQTRNRVDLGLGAFSVGINGSHTKVVKSRTAIPNKTENKIIDGSDPDTAAKYLISLAEGIR
ncbi:MAG: electron transfer flavoprotein subunit beta/FixA family protein [Candidatus Methanomethylophilaceae archaeon]